MTSIAPVADFATSHLSTPTFEELSRARAYADEAKSAATRRAYESDWNDFAAFCASGPFAALPAVPETIALYISGMAERLKIATIRRRVVSISRRHQEAGFMSPTAHVAVRAVLKGIANTKGVAPVRKDAMTLERPKDALLAVRGCDLQVARDRAIMLLGFWGGFRRSEIAALDVVDIRFAKEGLVVTLRRSKTDQAGEGREIGLPFLAARGICPVRAMRAWLDVASISEGAIFRSFGVDGRTLLEKRLSTNAIALIVKRLAKSSRLAGNFSAHSLRAGFITSAAAAGVSEVDVMRVTGHRSVTVLRGYVRRATIFQDAAQLRMAVA